MIIKKKQSGVFRFFLLAALLATLTLDFYYWTLLQQAPRPKIVRQEYGVFCVGEERPSVCYWFDNGGVIWKRALTIVGESVIKINEISPYQPRAGQLFLTEDLWQNLSLIVAFLKTGQLAVSHIILDRARQEVTVVTPAQTKVLFNLRLKFR